MAKEKMSRKPDDPEQSKAFIEKAADKPMGQMGKGANAKTRKP